MIERTVTLKLTMDELMAYHDWRFKVADLESKLKVAVETQSKLADENQALKRKVKFSLCQAHEHACRADSKTRIAALLLNQIAETNKELRQLKQSVATWNKSGYLSRLFLEIYNGK